MHLSLDYAHKFAQLAVRCVAAFHSFLFVFVVVVVSFLDMLCLLVVFVAVMLTVELKCCY